MKKKLVAVLIAAAMMISLATPIAAAADGELKAAGIKDLENATKVITDAVSELKGVFPAEEAVAVNSTFDDFLNVVGTGGSILTAINGSANFLKLIGVMKDSNAEALTNINTQVQSINETVAQMDRKLDNISAQMSKLQASAEFNARTEKSLLLEQNWKDFLYRYEEEGMDALMTEYNSMLLTGLQNWCANKTENARIINGVDNSRIILVYTGDAGNPCYFAENDVPAELPEGARVLILSSELLPEKITWNVNTYRDDIKNGIIALIKDRISAKNFEAFETVNFPEFTEVGSEGLTPELIDKVAEDAVNALSYRIACGSINKDSDFTLDVKRKYLNYCTHLLASDEGIDAVIKTFFLTHAFEFEVTSDIKEFCNEAAVKAGTYGAFAINVLGLSDFATDADKTDIMNAYCNTLNTIGQAKANSLTGKKQYCYITNSELYLGELRFYATATVETKEDKASSAFRSAKGGPITAKITGSWDKSFTPDRNSLIGDSDIILLGYTMQSSNGPVTFDYLKTHLSNGYISDYGAFVSSYNNETTLPLNTAGPLRVNKISGDYFTNGANVSFDNLPSAVKNKTDNFIHRRMVNGTVFNFSDFNSANQMLSGLAIYGENQWYWFHDEIAILGNNPYQSSFMDFLTRTQQSYQYYFTYDYSQNVGYNCLICRPLIPELRNNNEYQPLLKYTELNTEIETDSGERFKDVSPDSSGYDAVSWAAEKSIANGVGNDLFAPSAPCTRAQFITFLWRAVGCPVTDTALPFTDLKKGAYYTEAVRWAYAEGIAKGASTDTFLPDAVCSRAAAVSFLARFDGAQNTAKAGSFSDVKTTDYFAGAVQWATEKGITKGTSATTFSPQAPCTRQQAVMFLYRLMQ